MKNSPGKTLERLGILVTVLTGVLGWVLNLGFNRLVFTILGLPFVMLGAVLILDHIAPKYYEDSRLLRVANLLFNLSYMGTNVFLPDGMMDPPQTEGSGSGSYMLFQLIRNDDLYEPFMTAALIFFGCFAVTTVLQTVLLIILKRRRKKQQKRPA